MHRIEWTYGGQTNRHECQDGLMRVGDAWLVLIGDTGLALRAGLRQRLTPRMSIELGPTRLRWQPNEGNRPTPLEHEQTQRERKQTPALPFVIEQQGDGSPRPLPHGDLLLIGRHPWCDIVLDDPRVSALHCALRGQSSGVAIHDIASTNGTYVNGLRIASATVSSPAKLAIGRQQLRVRPEAPRAATTLPSPAMRTIEALVARIASSNAPVLIHGESGVGKERVAHDVHALSGRPGPFIALNAAALTPQLAGSELFGHVAGAFTGAEREHLGAFRAADGGTLFLDEIAELRPDVQAELLRVLEEHRVRPIGSTQTLPVDTRLVTATHCDLLKAVRQGRFREDLLHRIHVLPITVPPLRERREDIDAIAEAFLAEQGRRLSSGARAHLHRHAWPGNIRELINVLRRACALTDSYTLEPCDLQLLHAGPPASDLDGLIHQTVVDTFDRCGRSVGATARSLGVHRATVYRHLRRARVNSKVA